MNANSTKRLIVIVGPTAVGKTKLAIDLALRWKTEIISADSRQIYKELEIGTAKPTASELATVPHHFINFKSIEEDYDAGQFGRDAMEVLTRLFVKHDQIIVCGGSGLYIKALTEGFDAMPVIPEGMRESIVKEYELKGLDWLQQEVEKVDPEYFEIVDRQNPHRLIRALEINRASGKPMSEWRKKEKIQHPFQIIKIGIELDREVLYQRIDTRMDQMIADGLFEEAQHFYPQRNLNALQTVGYQEIFGFLEGEYDKAEAIQLLKRNSRRYAKRQLTWFKRDFEIAWFNPDNVNAIIDFILSAKPQ
jgi:tRNA dimethylallyltransferase